MIKKLDSKVVYKNPWMTVTEDSVVFPNGHKGIYGVVHKLDFALIVPFDGQYYYLVRQYRYPTEEYSWEFPQGTHEKDPTIKPEILAARELKEETGLTAAQLKKIGYLRIAPAVHTQGFFVYLATDLKLGSQELERAEDDIVIEKFTLAKIENMLEQGKITDCPTIAAYGLLKVNKLI